MLERFTKFTRTVFDRNARGTLAVFVLQLVASLTEGISILLLVPIMQLLDPAVAAWRIDIPHGPWRAAVGSQIVLGLFPALALFVAAITARAVLMRMLAVRTIQVTFDFVNGLREEVFTAVARARWPALISLRGSDVTHVLTADSDRVQSVLTQYLQIMSTLFLLLVYGAASLVISPALTLLALVIGIVVLAAMTPIRRAAFRYGSSLTASALEQSRVIFEFWTGLKAAKAANVEPVYVAHLSRVLVELRTGVLRYIRLYSLGGAIFQISAALGLALFVYFAAAEEQLPRANVIAMVLVLVRIAPRCAALNTSLQQFLTNVAALDAMISLRDFCLLHREDEGQSDSPGISLKRGLAFSHVGFSYGEERASILSDISFLIPANQITAVVGASGAGKSTVADLILGLLEPDAGKILIDDREMTPSMLRAWRNTVAYVPQETFLLHDTIASNLSFGRGEIGDAAMWQALTLANAQSFVSALPNGLATVVGDRGVRLSGGERQRLALARALIAEPQLLVLDEATSALDWENQALIAESIKNLRGRMTVVTIAHRPSMIAFADWVIVLEAGRVVQSGPFDDLARDSAGALHMILKGDSERGH